jgi:hypothetical protein
MRNELRERSATRLVSRLAWGVRWGALFGAAFVMIAVAIYFLSGKSAFESHRTTLLRMVLTYFVGGVLAGTVVGLLKPLTNSKTGAAIVGFAAALPVATLIRFATDGFGLWQRSDTIEAIVMGLILGAPTGVIYREIFRRDNATTHNGRR